MSPPVEYPISGYHKININVKFKAKILAYPLFYVNTYLNIHDLFFLFIYLLFSSFFSFLSLRLRLKLLSTLFLIP